MYKNTIHFLFMIDMPKFKFENRRNQKFLVYFMVHSILGRKKKTWQKSC